jgi:hypothetical protein
MHMLKVVKLKPLYGSHAEGWKSKATGNASHAEGSYTTASGFLAHAEGHNTLAVFDYSHAEGSLYNSFRCCFTC